MNKHIPILAALAFLLASAAQPAEAQQAGPAKGGMPPAQQMPQDLAPPAHKQMPAPKAAQGPVIQAKDLPGKAVLDQNGHKVAEVKKVLSNGSKPPHDLVLTVGSFLGFGGKNVVVPVEVIHVDQRGDLKVAMTEDQLKQFPPDTSQN